MDLMDASLKERLWHGMRQDLGAYIPLVNSNKLLMCCACGRFLPREHFSLEHIVPKQALADDPEEVRQQLTTNARSVNMLLCTKPLKIKGNTVYANGCNSWKGRFYDRQIRDILNGAFVGDTSRKQFTNQHTIAMISAGYLAMVAEFGYQIALTPSGQLLRRQFFMPNRFHPEMPLRSQMMLMAGPLDYGKAPISFWNKPFSFTIDRGFCLIGLRTSVAALPLSRDPRIPIATRIMIKPSRFTLRPDFSTVFE